MNSISRDPEQTTVAQNGEGGRFRGQHFHIARGVTVGQAQKTSSEFPPVALIPTPILPERLVEDNGRNR